MQRNCDNPSPNITIYSLNYTTSGYLARLGQCKYIHVKDEATITSLIQNCHRHLFLFGKWWLFYHHTAFASPSSKLITKANTQTYYRRTEQVICKLSYVIPMPLWVNKIYIYIYIVFEWLIIHVKKFLQSDVLSWKILKDRHVPFVAIAKYPRNLSG